MILAFGKPVSRAPDTHPLHSFKVRPRSKAPTFQAPNTQDLYAAAESTGCYQEEAIANWPLLSQIPPAQISLGINAGQLQHDILAANFFSRLGQPPSTWLGNPQSSFGNPAHLGPFNNLKGTADFPRLVICGPDSILLEEKEGGSISGLPPAGSVDYNSRLSFLLLFFFSPSHLPLPQTVRYKDDEETCECLASCRYCYNREVVIMSAPEVLGVFVLFQLL